MINTSAAIKHSANLRHLHTPVFLTGQTLIWMATGENWLKPIGWNDLTVLVSEWSTQDWIEFAVQVFMSALYSTFMDARYGGTVGKLALGIRITTPDGCRLSYAAAFRRHLALYPSMLPFVVPLPDSMTLSLLPCLGGFVMAAFDPQKRALHDRICGTRVVHMKHIPGMPPTI